jgi:SNF2 family DNA or RNA helicase
VSTSGVLARSEQDASAQVLDGIIGRPKSKAAAAAPAAQADPTYSPVAGAQPPATSTPPKAISAATAMLGRKSRASSFLKGSAKKLRTVGAAPSPFGAAAAGVAAALPPRDKVIVFSQWTSMLDLVEAALRDSGYAFRRVDGSLSLAQREEQLCDFKTRPSVCVLLLSLRAASLGLNLVVANHVVLLDLWWNPAVEDQAIDRTHRIGQSKGVHVTRITVKDTVEDRILQLQQRKREIVNAAFGTGGAGGGGGENRLTGADLQFLFS